MKVLLAAGVTCSADEMWGARVCVVVAAGVRRGPVGWGFEEADLGGVGDGGCGAEEDGVFVAETGWRSGI